MHGQQTVVSLTLTLVNTENIYRNHQSQASLVHQWPYMGYTKSIFIKPIQVILLHCLAVDHHPGTPTEVNVDRKHKGDLAEP